MFPAAVRALHAADLAAEGLQGGLNAGVHGYDGGGVAVGHSLVLAELGRRRRAGVVIMRTGKEVIHSSNGRSRGTRGSCGSGLSRRALWIKELGILLLFSCIVFCVFIYWSNLCTDTCSSLLFPTYRTSAEKMLNNLTVGCCFF